MMDQNRDKSVAVALKWEAPSGPRRWSPAGPPSPRKFSAAPMPPACRFIPTRSLPPCWPWFPPPTRCPRPSSARLPSWPLPLDPGQATEDGDSEDAYTLGRLQGPGDCGTLRFVALAGTVRRTAPALPLRAQALRCSALVTWGLLLGQPQRSRHRPPSPAADYYERAVNAALAGAALQGRLALEPYSIGPAYLGSSAPLPFSPGPLFYRDQLVSAAQDYQRALEFDPSHAPAQNALAWLTQGLGVAPNPAGLATLYSSGHQGHLEALFNGAVLKEQGLGGPVDVPGALAFYREAAVQGHEASLLRAGELLVQGQAPSPRRTHQSAPDHRSGSQPGRSRPAARHPVGAPRRRAGAPGEREPPSRSSRSTIPTRGRTRSNGK